MSGGMVAEKSNMLRSSGTLESISLMLLVNPISSISSASSNNHGMYPVELCHTSVYQVDKTAGCSDDYVYAFFECAYLAFDARPSVYRKNFQPVDMRRVIVEVAGYLQTQFTGGTENECLGLIDREVGFLYDGQSECRCFSRTCLCEGDDVGFFIEQQRNYFFLYRHGMFVPEIGNGFENFGTYAQFFESLHK